MKSVLGWLLVVVGVGGARRIPVGTGQLADPPPDHQGGSGQGGRHVDGLAEALRLMNVTPDAVSDPALRVALAGEAQ